MEASTITKCLLPADDGEKALRGHFYSVYIPLDLRQDGIEISNYIFKDKNEALKMVKKSKKARFKYFEYLDEAEKFAHDGIVDPPQSPSSEINGCLTIKNLTFSPQIIGERLSLFKGPKPQDLVKLRKSIEQGDVEFFQQAVWDNPRYLVSNGDTPSILQEGFRYNALHVAAKSKNGILAELILSTVSDPKFIKLLYGDDLKENIDNRIHVLVDLYLNTPDKGLNETPLHFAAKFGALDVVEVLASFPQCDKTLKNKYGHTPDMIICERCDHKDAELKKKIAMHLENCYYVPVLRAEDNSMTPVIGEPFSPGKPPALYKDPLSPRFEIHAYAGPMNKEGAEQFRKVWKTPPRTSTPNKRRKCDNSFDSVRSLRFTDPSKGLERLGQKLASQFDVNWKEYWSFLDCFVDITSPEGLNLLENYLAVKVANEDISYSSSPEREELSTNCTNKKTLSSISDLCLQMQNCNIDDSEDDVCADFNAFLCVEKACNVFANRISCEICNRINDNFPTQVLLLEMQMKQVELLILSYLDDSRFNIKVNFSQLHPRLGLLIAHKMCYLIERKHRLDYIKNMEKFLSECVKSFDCFSSDDEGNYTKDNKPTSSKKQLICIMQNVLNNFNQESEPRVELDNESACQSAWKAMKECSCVFHLKKSRKTRKTTSRKLFFSERKIDDLRVDTSSSSDDDEFFTPPGTPSALFTSDNEEDFDDVPLLSEIFIEGSRPTKTDCALFKALTCSDCHITPEKYPNICRWYHNINLYSSSERESWSKLSKTEEVPSTPPRPSKTTIFQSPPSSPWLRITGANSPRSSFPSFK